MGEKKKRALVHTDEIPSQSPPFFSHKKKFLERPIPAPENDFRQIFSGLSGLQNDDSNRGFPGHFRGIPRDEL
jgi:hypothetical protein